MGDASLEDVLQSAGDTVDLWRNSQIGAYVQPADRDPHPCGTDADLRGRPRLVRLRVMADPGRLRVAAAMRWGIVRGDRRPGGS